MRIRSSNVRTKIVALLLSLFALWVFAAYVTLREGVNLLSVSTLDSNLAQPSEPLLTEMQSERRLSLAYLRRPGAQQRAELVAQRGRTDQARATFAESARSSSVRTAGSAALAERIDEALGRLDALAAGRAAIDARGGADLGRAAAPFTDAIAALYQMYDSMATLDDKELAKDTRTLIQLGRARELVAQEDAMVTGVLAGGRFVGTEHEQFVQLVGAQRFYSALAASALPDVDKARYDEMANGPAFARLRGLEESLTRAGSSGGALPVSAAEWKSALEPVLVQFQDAILTPGDRVVERAIPVAVWVVVRLLLAGGLGLFAVVASVIVSVTTARALVSQLDKLRTAAWELANERLPDVVRRLALGEDVDVKAEAPPLTFGNDQIGQVGQAFNAVQETAVRVAVEQAQLRRSVRDVFLSIARRTQALVHRQLTLLDGMERREHGPEELADLFRVDHMATRMRRNAENLIVLSGAAPGRSWRRSVPMVDVVRAGVAEVEDYARVTVLPVGAVHLAGRAVGDLIHLLAELVENALSFSPPYTAVQVGGQLVANGYVIEIEDRGLGMSEEDLAAANARIANPPEFTLTSTARLGLYVVSRLAERHGIQVRLKPSPYGGTTAVVLIPASVVVEQPDAYGTPKTLPTRPATTTADAAPTAGNGTGDLAGTTAIARVAVVDPSERADRADWTRRAEPAADQPAGAALPQRRYEPDPPATGPGGGEQPPTDDPAASPPATDAGYTPGGLPVRIRDGAGFPPPTLTAPPPADGEPGEETIRPPEEIRKLMRSFQSGTLRGRADASRMVSEGGLHELPQPPADQPPGSPAP